MLWSCATFFFFFYRYGDHRDLHSFPTRRSSDLPEKIVDFAYRAVHEMTVKSKQVIDKFYDRAPQYSYFKGCSTGDRKSTRLNSSHSQISYAVFCLKKKKNNQFNTSKIMQMTRL